MDLQEENKKFACSLCATSFDTRSLFISHRIGTSHIKKLKTAFLHHEFLVECLACKLSLSDLKQAHAHMQLPQHKDLLKVFLKQGPPAQLEFVCESCGFAFGNQVALEVHRTLPPHQLAGSLSNLPNFYYLVKHLGGLPTGLSEPTCTGACRVCNEEYGRLDEFAFHLFSKLHIHRLRQSNCIMCRKDFIHASDREGHLDSSRHKLLLCMNIRGLLRKLQDITTLNKWGYLCMYCMIWCNSWPCFELHLLHSPHYEAVVNRKSNQPGPTILQEDNLLEGKEDFSLCEELTCTNWRRWREEPAGLSGWCHSCGTVLAFPDKAELHLEDHYLGKICQAGNSHPAVPIADSESPNICELFRCYVCSVSFRSAFSFNVHEALLQHHLRIAKQSFGEHRYWCANCGIDAVGVKYMQRTISSKSTQDSLMSSESIIKAKPSGAGGICYPDCLESQPPQLDEKGKKVRELGSSSLHVPSGTLSDVKKRCCNEGIKILGVDNQVLFEPKNRSTASPLARRHENFQRKSIKEELIDNGNTSFSSNECHEGQDACRETGVMTGKICADPSGIIPPPLGPDMVTSHVESKDNLQANSPSRVTNPSLGIPIVAASILSPSDSLQEALRSVMTVVVDTLSATLPVLHASSSICSGNCRKHEQEVCHTLEPDSKRMRLENALLEAVLQQGLQSRPSLLVDTSAGVEKTGGNLQQLCGNSTYKPSDPGECRRADRNCALQDCTDNCIIPKSHVDALDGTADHRSGNVADVTNGLAQNSISLMTRNFQHVASVVVVAAVVPHSSATPVACIGSANNPPCAVAEAKENKCLDNNKHETESIRSLTVDNSVEAMQVHSHGSPCQVDELDKVKVESRRLEDEPHKLQGQILTKETGSKSCVSFPHKDHCTRQASHVVSDSSTSTDGETESDSGCGDLLSARTCVKVLQTANLSASDTENSSDSESDY